jgi:hypothetical protein
LVKEGLVLTHSIDLPHASCLVTVLDAWKPVWVSVSWLESATRTALSSAQQRPDALTTTTTTTPLCPENRHRDRTYTIHATARLTLSSFARASIALNRRDGLH